MVRITEPLHLSEAPGSPRQVLGPSGESVARQRHAEGTHVSLSWSHSVFFRPCGEISKTMKAAGDENIFLINSRARLALGVIAGQCHTWAGVALWVGDHSRGRLSRTLEPSRWPLWVSSGSWGQVSSLNTSFPHDQVGH